MNLSKYIAILAITGVTSLFAAEVKQISILVDQINNTSDVKAKKNLMDTLEKELEMLDKKDITKAQAIVDEKLKSSN